MDQHPKTAFKILTKDQWEAWQTSGTFTGASIDLTDGYIHLSTARQAKGTVQKYFTNQTDLVLAEVDLDKVHGELKWEPSKSRNDELFPHVYGTIPLEAVMGSWTTVDAALFDQLIYKTTS